MSEKIKLEKVSIKVKDVTLDLTLEEIWALKREIEKVLPTPREYIPYVSDVSVSPCIRKDVWYRPPQTTWGNSSGEITGDWQQ